MAILEVGPSASSDVTPGPTWGIPYHDGHVHPVHVVHTSQFIIIHWSLHTVEVYHKSESHKKPEAARETAGNVRTPEFWFAVDLGARLSVFSSKPSSGKQQSHIGRNGHVGGAGHSRGKKKHVGGGSGLKSTKHAVGGSRAVEHVSGHVAVGFREPDVLVVGGVAWEGVGGGERADGVKYGRVLVVNCWYRCVVEEVTERALTWTGGADGKLEVGWRGDYTNGNILGVKVV